VKYANEWALTTPIVVPVKRDLTAATRSVAFHATLLYSSPLALNLSVRSRNRLIREQLLSYTDLLEIYGFIQTTKLFKDISHKFLRGFRVSSGKLTYEPVEDISLTPMYRLEKMLVGRELDMDSTDRELIQYMLSWFLYLSKVPLGRPDLKSPAQKAWIERQVNPLPLTTARQNIEAVRMIVSWLVGFDFQFLGNHGPGSTSTGAKTVPEKNRDYRPTLQTTQLTRFHVSDAVWDVYRPREAVWKDVPKDIGSLRPITMEPPEMQFAQQGMKHDIYRAVNQGHVLASRYIKFDDQTLSQECAIRGSSLIQDRRKPSTIDLSSASDYLSLDLIVDIFSGDLLHYLLLGRTWNVLVNKKKVELNMFGGMGSALTFPVQSIVFAALTIWSVIQALVKEELGVEAGLDDLETYLLSNGFHRRYAKIEKSIRVYGDDIAVPDFAAERLMLLLSEFGLKVNVDKSFVGISPVRESCGVYALAGYDITPKRYRLPAFLEKIDGPTFEAIRAHANEAYHMGWTYLNRAFIRLARDTEKFMSSKEHSRRLRRGKAYPDQEYGPGRLLFEEDRGRADYIGFVSMRSSSPYVPLRLHEAVRGFTTFVAVAETKRDDESEFYHLTVNYRQMGEDRPSIEFHGSTPYRVRLEKRNAIQTVPHGLTSTMVWGWAPR